MYTRIQHRHTFFIKISMGLSAFHLLNEYFQNSTEWIFSGAHFKVNRYVVGIPMWKINRHYIFIKFWIGIDSDSLAFVQILLMFRISWEKISIRKTLKIQKNLNKTNENRTKFLNIFKNWYIPRYFKRLLVKVRGYLNLNRIEKL